MTYIVRHADTLVPFLIFSWTETDSELSFCCAVFVQEPTAECGHDVQWHRTGLINLGSIWVNVHLLDLPRSVVERQTVVKKRLKVGNGRYIQFFQEDAGWLDLHVGKSNRA